jgi:hypothetical protein
MANMGCAMRELLLDRKQDAQHVRGTSSMLLAMLRETVG